MRWCENKVVNSRRKALNQGGLRAGSSHLMWFLKSTLPTSIAQFTRNANSWSPCRPPGVALGGVLVSVHSICLAGRPVALPAIPTLGARSGVHGACFPPMMGQWLNAAG